MGLHVLDLGGVHVAVEEVEHTVALEHLTVVGAAPDGVRQHPDPDPPLAQPLPQGPHLRVGVGVRLPEPPVCRERQVVPVVGGVDPGLLEDGGDRGALVRVPPSLPGALLGIVDAQREGVGLGEVLGGHLGGVEGQAVHLSGVDPPLLGRSTSCHGVSVPPQSKMTASTGWWLWLTPRPRALRPRRRRRHRRPGTRCAPRRAVLDLDLALGQPAPDDDDGRHPDQLGVLELHARADALAVVEDDRQALCLKIVRDLGALDEDLLVLSGGDQVHVGRRDLAGPDQPELVVVSLGDGGHGA